MPRNAWRETVNLADLFHNEYMSFPDKRDAIVDRIKDSRWYRRAEEEGGELFYVVDKLADATDTDDFDSVWSYVYDVADDDRVWIATR